MDERWIVIPNWERFQHYSDRDPAWIKNYLSLLHKDEYLRLTGHQRAVLHGLWLAYAAAHCQLRVDTLSLTRQIGLRVSSRTLELLNHAGLVEFSASKPRAPAPARSREGEKEKEEETPQTPLSRKPETRDLAKRTRKARAWLKNVGGQVPAGHLEEALTDQFKLPDELVTTLLGELPRRNPLLLDDE